MCSMFLSLGEGFPIKMSGSNLTLCGDYVILATSVKSVTVQTLMPNRRAKMHNNLDDV